MIAIVSHDAGGAEILSSYARRRPQDFVFVLDGPARRIFERKLGSVEVLSLEEAAERSVSILTGTSYQSDLELRGIEMARARSRPSAAFLDHWVNYAERFCRPEGTVRPDEIWVGDIFAEQQARRVFSGQPIRRVDNPYFEDIRKELAALPVTRPSTPGRLSLLYVCEPVSEVGRRLFGDARHWGYVEEDALRYFLAHADVLGKPIERIRIRPHPSESAGKYDWARHEFDLPIEFGGAETLVQEIAASDVVVGCQSMAMVVGLLAGKRVLSCIPPGGTACVLPQPEIEQYQRLVTAKNQK